MDKENKEIIRTIKQPLLSTYKRLFYLFETQICIGLIEYLIQQKNLTMENLELYYITLIANKDFHSAEKLKDHIRKHYKKQNVKETIKTIYLKTGETKLRENIRTLKNQGLIDFRKAIKPPVKKKRLLLIHTTFLQRYPFPFAYSEDYKPLQDNITPEIIQRFLENFIHKGKIAILSNQDVEIMNKELEKLDYSDLMSLTKDLMKKLGLNPLLIPSALDYQELDAQMMIRSTDIKTAQKLGDKALASALYSRRKPTKELEKRRK